MGMTMTQKILAKAAGLSSVQPGQLIEARLNLVLGNDITTPVAITEFEKAGFTQVFDKDRIAIVLDHYTPCKDIKSAQLCKQAREFAHKHSITHFYDVGQVGVEHALIPEKGLAAPGEVIVGADSHTCTYGALGAFSTGIGSTDMAAGMATGLLWFKVPAAIKVVLKGKLQPMVSGKDVILHLIGLIGVAGMGITGDSSAREVSIHQPAKFAAMEGVMESGAPQALHLIGWMNPSTHEVTGVSIPYLLTLLTHHDLDTAITGMNGIPQDERPPILPVFYSFHLMILIGCALAALFLVGLWGWKKGWLFQKRWLLWCFVFSVLGPQIANQAGWAVAELGRQPWIVYGILRTEHAVSPTLTAAEAFSSLGMFFIIYALLLALFLYQITHKIHKGPDQETDEDDGAGEGKLQVPFVKD